MKRSALLFTVLLLLATHPALADCYEYTVIDYQVTTWWDGSQTLQILGMETFGYCDTSRAAAAIPGVADRVEDLTVAGMDPFQLR